MMNHQMSTVSRAPWLAGVLMLAPLLFASGCTGLMAKVYADTTLHPARQPLVKAPSDYGMEYEDISFQAEDGVELKGWLVPGTQNELVIVSHPLAFTRYGYSADHEPRFVDLTDEDVEFLETVKNLHDAGYWVLSFDFRNHGESGTSPNDGINGVGVYEYKDLIAAVQYARSSKQLQHMKVALLSFCQGANATFFAMNEAPDEFRDIVAFVAVQPISLRVFTSSYGRAEGISPKVLERAEQNCIARGGPSWDESSVIGLARNVFVPTLVMQVRGDPWTDPDYVQAVYDEITAPKEILWVEGQHRFDGYNYFGDHPEKLLAFLDEHMPDDEVASPSTDSADGKDGGS